MTTRSGRLRDIVGQIEWLDVACPRYDRRGRYPVASLIATYGADVTGAEVLRRLGRVWPRPEPAERRELCDANCPGLAVVLIGPRYSR
jgi:hypothetical protein